MKLVNVAAKQHRAIVAVERRLVAVTIRVFAELVATDAATRANEVQHNEKTIPLLPGC